MSLKIAVLASHTGTNLQALHAAQQSAPFTVSLVVSNNGSSGALAYARERGIPYAHLSGRTHPDPDALDEVMLAALRAHGIDMVVTAGYMKKIGPATLAAYDKRILNIHPALLPRHGGHGMYGLHVHRAVLAAGDVISGATVHLVTAEYDEGPIIARQEVPVLPTDTPESLAERVLAAEHLLLPSVLRDMAVQSTDDGQQENAPAL